MENKKVFTYHIDAGDGEVIVTKENLIQGIENVLPNDYDLECEHDEPESDGSIMTVTIKIKKYMTQKQIDSLPELN